MHGTLTPGQELTGRIWADFDDATKHPENWPGIEALQSIHGRHQGTLRVVLERLDREEELGIQTLEQLRDGVTGPEPYEPPRWGPNEDHLPVELFMRYGSVKRGEWRKRQHWVDDATAIRAAIAASPQPEYTEPGSLTEFSDLLKGRHYRPDPTLPEPDMGLLDETPVESIGPAFGLLIALAGVAVGLFIAWSTSPGSPLR